MLAIACGVPPLVEEVVRILAGGEASDVFSSLLVRCHICGVCYIVTQHTLRQLVWRVSGWHYVITFPFVNTSTDYL